MFESNRRTFFRSSVVCATAAVVTSEAAASQATANPTAITGYNYQLPKFSQGTTLLFQGDSITDMNWGRNQSDRNHYLGHSYVYLIASRLHMDMPQAQLNFLNRGISGHTVGELKARWQQDALDLKPDVLSILVGINDVGRAVRAKGVVDVDAFAADYHSLLQLSRMANPELKIVLLEPFVLPVTRVKAEWDAWRGQVERLRPIVAKLATEYDAILIKTQDIFDTASQHTEPSHWIWDGVHPLPQGHELIARHWIDTVAKTWT
jgi:lysophospholipase L1-like esterase